MPFLNKLGTWQVTNAQEGRFMTINAILNYWQLLPLQPKKN